MASPTTSGHALDGPRGVEPLAVAVPVDQLGEDGAERLGLVLRGHGGRGRAASYSPSRARPGLEDGYARVARCHKNAISSCDVTTSATRPATASKNGSPNPTTTARTGGA